MSALTVFNKQTFSPIRGKNKDGSKTMYPAAMLRLLACEFAPEYLRNQEVGEYVVDPSTGKLNLFRQYRCVENPSDAVARRRMFQSHWALGVLGARLQPGIYESNLPKSKSAAPRIASIEKSLEPIQGERPCLRWLSGEPSEQSQDTTMPILQLGSLVQKTMTSHLLMSKGAKLEELLDISRKFQNFLIGVCENNLSDKIRTEYYVKFSENFENLKVPNWESVMSAVDFLIENCQNKTATIHQTPTNFGDKPENTWFPVITASPIYIFEGIKFLQKGENPRTSRIVSDPYDGFPRELTHQTLTEAFRSIGK